MSCATWETGVAPRSLKALADSPLASSAWMMDLFPPKSHCRTPKHQARDSTRQEPSSQQKLCQAPGIRQAGDGRP